MFCIRRKIWAIFGTPFFLLPLFYLKKLSTNTNHSSNIYDKPRGYPTIYEFLLYMNSELGFCHEDMFLVVSAL